MTGVEQLSAVPFFGGLDDAQLSELASALDDRPATRPIRAPA
jgi:hypothetical protein